MFPKRSAKVIDGKQENPKFLRSLQNAERNTTNLAISINSVNVIALMEMRVVKLEKLREFKTAVF